MGGRMSEEIKVRDQTSDGPGNGFDPWPKIEKLQNFQKNNVLLLMRKVHKRQNYGTSRSRNIYNFQEKNVNLAYEFTGISHKISDLLQIHLHEISIW